MDDFKSNKALRSLEFQMALDEMRESLPLWIEQKVLISKVLKASYDSLLKEGFTEAQALEITCKRPLIG